MGNQIVNIYRHLLIELSSSEAHILRRLHSYSHLYENNSSFEFVSPLSECQKSELKYPELIELYHTGDRDGVLCAKAKRWMDLHSYNEGTNINAIINVTKIHFGFMSRSLFISEYELSKFVPSVISVDGMSAFEERQEGQKLHFGFEIHHDLMACLKVTLFNKISDKDSLTASLAAPLVRKSVYNNWRAALFGDK